MYFLNEKKTKLIICSLLIVLSVSTLLIGRTLVNTLIVSTYPITILPYFYLVQAALLMITTAVTSGYQNKYLKKFTIIFKGIAVLSLLVFSVALKSNLPAVPFIISIAILTFTSIISDIPWNYAAQIFDIQEYKQFSKLLQVSGTFGVIVTGAMITFLSAKLGLSALLPVMAFIEFVSIFFIILVSKYVSTLAIVSKNQPNFFSIAHETSIFKYLALFTIVAVIVTTLIDYNFKLSLSTEIEKQKIIDVVTLVFVISTAGTLIVQVFLLDYSLRVLGSKKIIIIFPSILLIAAFAALLSPAFSFVALLAIINDMFFYSTWSLSKNLYLNTLSSSIKNLGLLKLSGIIKPISVGLGSITIFILTPYKNPRLSIALVTVSCVYMLYLSRILIREYSTQLAKSIYLRRFNPELINAADKNRQEIERAISQALDDNAPEAKLFALQLLANNKNLHLPKSIKPLLLTKNVGLLKETARVLTMHPNQPEFVAEAADAFSKSRDMQVRWYLVLYLIEMKRSNLLVWAHKLIKSKICASLAIACLIYMKQGNLEQQITAMTHLTKMLHSNSEEQQKWLLIVLNELPHINKEEYLIKFINEGSPAIQTLALQQASKAANKHLLNTLIGHLGEQTISHALHNSLIEIGDQVIGLLEEKIKQAPTYQIKASCILILTKIRGIKAEIALINILSSTNDVVIKTVLAKYLAYRGVKNKISETMRSFLSKEIKIEVDFYVQLSNQSLPYTNSLIIAEINSRIQFIKRRVLYYLASISGSIDLLNSIPLLTSVNPNKNQQAIALELIDSKIEDRTISSLMIGVFTETKPKTIIDNGMAIADPWLQEFIHKVESNNMESIYKLTRLRRIDLFRNLTAETLQVLAECCVSKDMAKDEVIFNEGDQGDGLYIIDSGEVVVTKQEKVLANLAEGAYFGELALLADTPRFATVTAASEGALFYIDKQDFDRVTDEIPEIMKSITRQVIGYFPVLAMNY